MYRFSLDNLTNRWCDARYTTAQQQHLRQVYEVVTSCLELKGEYYVNVILAYRWSQANNVSWRSGSWWRLRSTHAPSPIAVQNVALLLPAYHMLSQMVGTCFRDDDVCITDITNDDIGSNVYRTYRDSRTLAIEQWTPASNPVRRAREFRWSH